MQWVGILAALGAGLLLPLQPGVNAELRRYLGSPFLAALGSFAGGTLALFCLSLALRVPWPSLHRVAQTPWWAWTGGFIGVCIVTTSIVLAPRIGAAALFSAVVTGQLVGSLLVDHFGLVGFEVQRLNAVRVLGVVLLLAGVYVIQLGSSR
ncbi:MAG TPA: DMT family transporter [Myxococcales bacterium LLY-WYZ-16_1]|jgi:bacterial/archaeal transporter family-2 protein|nr:DMT family transporter [Myxococcales bacterium LLY-WYZ-16_1]